MQTSRHSLTPLAAVAGGIPAGAIGTVCLDAVQYLKYRRSGGTEKPLQWEFASIDSWEKAPDPGQVAKRVVEGFTPGCTSRSGSTTRRPWPGTWPGI